LEIVELLSNSTEIPITYAGGIRNLKDLDLIEKKGQGKIDATIGSALDIFGGKLSFESVVEWHKKRN
jgi:phosphoribosylformimino-5-aminoimidazole carboxamide ribotide isomerase